MSYTVDRDMYNALTCSIDALMYCSDCTYGSRT